MKNKGFVFGIAIFCFFTMFLNILRAEDKAEIDKAIKGLNSPERDQRIGAFYYFEEHIDSLKSDRVKIALFNLLKTETNYKDSLSPEQWGKLGEGYSGYLVDLFSEVDNLKDKRAIPEIIRFGKGCIGETGLLFPEVTIPLLISSLENLYSSKKYLKFEKDQITGNYDTNITQEFECTFGSFEKLLAADKIKNNLSSEERNQIRKGLLDGINDKSHFVRIFAVRGLAEIHDPEVITILKSIKNNDPKFYPMHKSKENPNGKRYLVREEAKKALDKLNVK